MRSVRETESWEGIAWTKRSVLRLGLPVMGTMLLEGIGKLMMCFFAVAYSI
jgi:hypothetical protein